jgi:hypothetical protein
MTDENDPLVIKSRQLFSLAQLNWFREVVHSTDSSNDFSVYFGLHQFSFGAGPRLAGLKQFQVVCCFCLRCLLQNADQ